MNTEMSIEEQIEYLKKQKRGEISGGFADLLTCTYNFLTDQLSLAKVDYCNPFDSDICRAVYGDAYHIPMIRKFMYRLQKMGYISIIGSGRERQIRILKTLDF